MFRCVSRAQRSRVARMEPPGPREAWPEDRLRETRERPCHAARRFPGFRHSASEDARNPGYHALRCRPRAGARACTHLRECWSALGQSSATAFPPPMRVRDREGGTTSTAVVSNAMPDKCRSEIPDFQNLRAEAASRSVPCRHPPPCPSPAWGEGTVWRASSQLFSREL
jgi:hypothetical protein